MRGLSDLLSTSEGKAFLAGRGVVTVDELPERLRRPAAPGIGAIAGLRRPLPVYLGHQVMADYGPTVVAKFRAGRRLEHIAPEVSVVLVWADTDRAGADRWTAGFQLEGRAGRLHVRLGRKRDRGMEARFAPVDRQRLEQEAERVAGWARTQKWRTGERAAAVAEVLRGMEPGPLSRVNLGLSAFALREALGWTPASVMVSELLDAGLLTGVAEELVALADDVVAVWNAAVEVLVARDVDPQVRPLPPDHLPLRYACDRDGRRLPLLRERRGSDAFAVATCACGTEYRFALGPADRPPSLAILAATGRWSPDVTLPIYLNDLFSGVVAGRSSALYGLVMNEVLQKVLGRTPIPMAVPSELAHPPGGDEAGLIQAYVSGAVAPPGAE